jgi:aspartyl-tRNA(Asn)/glutamyl-tRNA(Gln) amidotransferase subunit C
LRAHSPQGVSLRPKTPDFPVSLDKDQVQHIATLARLRVANDELAETVDKLSRIVDFVAQLSQAATDDVVPMAHPLNQVQRLRPDRINESNDRDRFQNNAPAVTDGFYLVPKVIE